MESDYALFMFTRIHQWTYLHLLTSHVVLGVIYNLFKPRNRHEPVLMSSTSKMHLHHHHFMNETATISNITKKNDTVVHSADVTCLHFLSVFWHTRTQSENRQKQTSDSKRTYGVQFKKKRPHNLLAGAQIPLICIEPYWVAICQQHSRGFIWGGQTNICTTADVTGVVAKSWYSLIRVLTL